MKKIIYVDELPINCDHCELWDYNICYAENEDDEIIPSDKERPSNCPLKLISELKGE